MTGDGPRRRPSLRRRRSAGSGISARTTRRLDQKHLWNTLPIVVVIDDGNGYRSIYAHFSKIVVKKGQTVKAGQLLGYEGMTGRASGCHLHYGLFSPQETDSFGIDAAVAKRMKLPRLASPASIRCSSCPIARRRRRRATSPRTRPRRA